MAILIDLVASALFLAGRDAGIPSHLRSGVTILLVGFEHVLVAVLNFSRISVPLRITVTPEYPLSWSREKYFHLGP